MHNHIILGECKRTLDPMDAGTLRSLVDKARLAFPTHDEWQVYFLDFSRGRFTHEAEDFSQAIEEARPGGARWSISRCLLVDLPCVNRDLAEWTN